MEDKNSRSIDGEFGAAAVMARLGEPIDPVMVGRFELVREIGFGTYGTVYEAIDRDLGRRVAVKVLDTGDPDVATREGKILAEIKHPNVVAIHDHGIGPDYRYLVMELLDGPTLRTWWGDKTPTQIVAKFLEVASGLAAVHANDLVHRDFKPSNVRFRDDGQAVVVDFGLARHLTTLTDDPEEIGVFAGTTDYAAPERLAGLSGDGRADQFSVCVALWEALCGTNPFGPCSPSTTPMQRLRSIRAQAGTLVGTPRGSRRVVRALRRGLAYEAADRFPNMRAFAAALAPKPRRWGRRDVLVASVAVVLIVLGASALPQLVPGRGSLEFVGNARMSWLGQRAILAAREGNVDGALWRLEEAKRAELSGESSRKLALVSEEVALVLERLHKSSDARIALHLSLLFARDAGDADVEERIRQRIRASIPTRR